MERNCEVVVTNLHISGLKEPNECVFKNVPSVDSYPRPRSAPGPCGTWGYNREQSPALVEFALQTKEYIYQGILSATENITAGQSG